MAQVSSSLTQSPMNLEVLWVYDAHADQCVVPEILYSQFCSKCIVKSFYYPIKYKTENPRLTKGINLSLKYLTPEKVFEAFLVSFSC